ncbi:MAG: DUF1993 domain-containing protein [Polyangiaceae bacterium]
MYFSIINQFKKSLTQLDTMVASSLEHATKKPFDPAILVNARLAPDQFPLGRQVQIACDTAKLGAARLAGKEAPKKDDTETTLDELRARIKWTIDYLDTLKASDFEKAATQTITQPRWEGKTMTGADYLLEHVIPNFYFHMSHAYAILRHNGVNVGKRDYLGPLTQTLPA